jgi:hypothetical protein
MLDESARERIAALADHKVAAPEAPKQDTVWNALSREAYVIGGGVADGFSSHLNARSLIEKTPELVTSFGIGAALAVAQGKSGIVKLGAEVIGLSFGVAMVKDMTNPERVNGLSTAISNTWNSPSQLDYNRALVKQHAGDFVFDTTLMAAGGIAGASTVKVARSEAAQGLRSLFGKETANGTPRGLVTASEMRAATLGVAEIRGGSLGAVEAPRGLTPGSKPLNASESLFGGSSRSLRTEVALGAAEKVAAKPTAATTAESSLGAIGEGSQSLQGPRPMMPDARDLPAYGVFPVGPMKPNAQAFRLAAEGQTKPLSEIQAAERVVWEFKENKTADWKPNKESLEVRGQAEQFVQRFMAGDYAGALNVAVEAPVMARVNLNPPTRIHEVKINADELAKPEIVELKMNELSKYAEFKWAQSVRDGIVDETKLEVVIPKTIVELKSGAEVRIVDIVPVEQNGYRQSYKMEFPSKDVKGNPLTPEQLKEIEAIRQSPGGQRLLAETALFGFEETIVHANQHITQGGAISSPAFAEFARNVAARSETNRGHRLAFLGMIDSQHAMRPKIMEQEVPALAYDAGMPLSMVRHHFFFGARHVQERTPVMDFLQLREMYGRQPNHKYEALDND